MNLGIELLGDLAFLLIACAGVGTLAYVLRQPLILGFLAAGILIGPFGPFSLIKNIDMLNNFSDIAIVLLLFGVGLTFPLSKLRNVGKVGVTIAVIEVMVMLGIGFVIGQLFGWSFYDSMFLAAALSISSTAVIIKVLEDRGSIETTSGMLLTGVLIIEDIIAIILISTLHSGVVTGSFEYSVVIWTIAKIGIFFAVTLGLGILLVPKLFGLIAKLERFEITMTFALGLAFGLSFLTHELGFSAATGAFLAGVMIAGSKFSDDVSTLITPIREVFVAIFFVTIGALMNLSAIGTFWIPIIVITILTIFGKILGVYMGVKLFGSGKQYALAIGLSMASLGEFSFIVLKTGMDLGVVSDNLFPIVGMVVVLTTFLGVLMAKKGIKTVELYE
ncbi:Kef-type K transport system, membrane component [Nitrosarchaeum koreense MY1]|uniref:Kef-type K transport system, membrane component n=1 Tax=Nitrosarchaeum koreense MY1 TaxID=1001994 RepID=F9CZ71_9ARCH|nr:Kef-type K transport system, membrane component [Nitrosarchaeum koreense MY1]HSA76791.1 cation:proton antiporter [Nitrosarchaeum sp.]